MKRRNTNLSVHGVIIKANRVSGSVVNNCIKPDSAVPMLHV